MHLHWDGDNDSVAERNLSAGLGAGITPVTVDHASFQRVRDWIWTLPPPQYPFSIDRTLASRGQTVYQQECLNCPRGSSVPRGRHVGHACRLGRADRSHRHRSPSSSIHTRRFSRATSTRSSRLLSIGFSTFRKTDGYANQPLDGIWARAPYLHNGSVPTLRDLLEPVERRPATFFRGYDVFDQVKVGFVSDVATADGRTYFRYDTSIPGNSNSGHLYGLSLPDEDKRAVVEYLKTF
jgi:hypothetical protein